RPALRHAGHRARGRKHPYALPGAAMRHARVAHPVDRHPRYDRLHQPRFPRVNRIAFLECAANSGMEWRGAQLNGCQYTHGMVHCVEYTGVPLRLLLEQAGLRPNAKWIMAEGADAAAMNRSI